jgi:hypothetical protein
MTIYTVNGASVGTEIQTSPGGIISIQTLTPPAGSPPPDSFNPVNDLPVSNYFCLADSGPAHPRSLVCFEADNPCFGVGATVRVGAAFTRLFVSSVPPGASYSVVTT